MANQVTIQFQADRRLSEDCAEIFQSIGMEEYNEVLRRETFHLQEETVRKALDSIEQTGVEVLPQPTGEILVDMTDLIFL